MLRACYHKAKQIKNVITNTIYQPNLVLLYHRINKLEHDTHMLAVTPENFYQHIKYLKENYNIIPLTEIYNKQDKISISITFDDGYADNYQNALPVLEELQAPATIFVSSGNLDSNKEFWWDYLERIMLISIPKTLQLQINTSIGKFSWNIIDKESIIKAHNQLHPIIKKLDSEEREKLLQDIAAQFNINKDSQNINRSLNEQELKKLSQSPYITIGAHTITHTPLSSQAYQKQYHEIKTSKQQLEEYTQKDITTFSYPFGGNPDYTAETIKIVQQIGFTHVASNFPGTVHTWTDKYQIPRHLVRNWDIEEFKHNLQGFLKT